MLFDWRMRRAVRKAKNDASEYRKKFLVIVHGGRPVCVSSQGIKQLIRRGRFRKGVTYDMILKKAIFIAYPPQIVNRKSS